jgi:hypothetical protein
MKTTRPERPIGTRKRLFGPLLGGVLILGAFELIGLWVGPRLPSWSRYWEACGLTGALGNANLQTRETAAHRLSLLGADAVSPVLDSLRSGNDFARPLACRLLFTTNPTPLDAIAALRAALADRSPQVVAAAALELASASELELAGPAFDWQPVIIVLRSLLKHVDPTVRTNAACALGTFGSDAQNALPELAALLSSPDSLTRLTAVCALQRIEGNLRPDSKSCLWNLITDPSPSPKRSIRGQAADQLLRTDPSLEGNVVRAFSRLAHSQHREVRFEAIRGIEQLQFKTHGRKAVDRAQLRQAVPVLLLRVSLDDPELRFQSGALVASIEPEALRLVSPLLLLTYLGNPMSSSARSDAELLLDRAQLTTERRAWEQRLHLLDDYLFQVVSTLERCLKPW